MAHSKFASKLKVRSLLTTTIARAVECQWCDNSEFFYDRNITPQDIANFLYEAGWRYAISKKHNVDGAICNECYNRECHKPEFMIFE